MFKIMVFARMKPGLNREDLIARYEGTHIPLTDSLVDNGLLPAMADYRRNYIVHTDERNVGHVEYDVVTEAWFANADIFEENRNGLQNADVAAAVGEDLASFLDLESMKMVVIEEHRGGGAGAAT
jgi:hypothetical protein